MYWLKKGVTKTAVLYVEKIVLPSEKSVVCNLNCLHCYNRFGNYKFKTLSEINSEIDFYISKGVNHIQLMGAEPTMHPNFFKILEYIKYNSLVSSIISNGILIANKIFANKLVGLIDYCAISMHGSSKETVNYVSQSKFAWDKINLALQNLSDLNIETHINYTILKPNYRELPNIINIAEKYSSVSDIILVAFNPWHSIDLNNCDYIKSMLIKYDDTISYIDKFSYMIRNTKLKYVIRYYPYCKISESERCFAFNYTNSYVDPNEWRRELWYNSAFEKNKTQLKYIISKMDLKGSYDEQMEYVFSRYYKKIRSFFYTHTSCKNCSHRPICDMPHKAQVEFFPEQTYESILGDEITDVKYYFKKRNDGIEDIKDIYPKLLNNNLNIIRIACSTDKNYVDGTIALINSIIYNSKLNFIIIYLLYSDLDNDIINDIKTKTMNCNLTLNFVKVNISKFEKFKCSRYITTAAYFRLDLPNLIDDSIDKILYLDSDIILNDDISKLYNKDISNYYLLAVQDWVTKTVSMPLGLSAYKKLGLDINTKYFNSGVMLLNLKCWRQNNLSEKLFSYLIEYNNNIESHDQDALNAIVAGKWGKLDNKWNSIVTLVNPNDFSDKRINPEVLKNPSIIHFSADNKPWNFDYSGPYKKLFLKYFNLK